MALRAYRRRYWPETLLSFFQTHSWHRETRPGCRSEKKRAERSRCSKFRESAFPAGTVRTSPSWSRRQLLAEAPKKTAANIVPTFSAGHPLAQNALHLLRKSLKILFALARDRSTTARRDHQEKEPEWLDRSEPSADRARRDAIRKLLPAAACWRCKMWSKRGNRGRSLRSRNSHRQSPGVQV